MAIADNTVAKLMSRLGIYRDVLERKLDEAQKSLKELSDVGQEITLARSVTISLKTLQQNDHVRVTFSGEDKTSVITICSLEELRKLVLKYQVCIEENLGVMGKKEYKMKYIIPNTKLEVEEKLNYMQLWYAGLNGNSGSVEEKTKLTHSFIAYYIYSNKTREQLEKMVRNTQRFLQVSEVLESEEQASKEDSSEEQTSKDDAGEEQVDKDPGCLQQSLSSERKDSFNELATFLSSKPTPWQSFCAALPFCPCWKKLKSPHLAMSAEINALITKSAVPLGM